MESIFSFDIFDTLLLRPYADPQEVWNVLEETEQTPGYAIARKKADAKTFKDAIARGGETTIEEAYSIIPEYKHLMQKEMELERKSLKANPEMLKIWNELGERGKRRIIVSDMYLPSGFIQCVLKEKGYDGWDGFYLSRDYDCRKSSGKLYEVMLQKERVRPDEVFHIGDNIVSDVKIPQSLGIHARHYHKVIDRLYDVCPFTRFIDGRLSGTLAIGWHQFVLNNPNATYWHRIGFMMGGVLGYIYVKWIVETARSLGIDRLMFVARDGYILKSICNSLYPEMQTDYIYAPRITSVAILGAIGSDKFAKKDREEYFNSHYKDANIDEIRDEYKDYISDLKIDSDTAIVDGCSSGFSAQKLIENIVGTSVYSFYLAAMSEKNYAAALYSTNQYVLPFQLLSEFIFGSPESPIIGIKRKKPIYSKEVSPEELFKISKSEEIREGAVACSKALMDVDVKVSGSQWLIYVDNFMNYKTKEDISNLERARNAADVEQKKFLKVTYTPYKDRFFEIKWKKFIPIEMVFRKGDKRHSFSYGKKGLNHRVDNIKVTIGDYDKLKK